MKTCLAITIIAALAWPGIASAHPAGTAHVHGFTEGLLHPLTGVDHLAAAVAVGVWGGRMGGLKMWLLPIWFVTAMSIGILFGSPIASASVESAVAVSVLCLGLLLTFDAKLPLPAAIAIVASAAFAHGAAHATGQTLSPSFAAFAAGALVTTAVLHAAGVITARSAQGWPLVSRFGGAAIALLGAGLLTGLLSA